VTYLWKLASEESLQYGVFIGLSLIVFVLTGMIYQSSRSSFQRFFGSLNPLLAVLIVIILGLSLLSFLLYKTQLAIYSQSDVKGRLLAAGLALLFAVVMILVDRAVVFPADLNVPFPHSLAFYPVMGYVAEIIFHVLPLVLLYFFLNALLGEMSPARLLWVSILIVALIEPIFQIRPFAGQYSNWTVASVGLHIFLLNLVQLLIFRRYDFVTMYSFRLVYYLLWHILWGHLRLSLLFQR